MLIRFVILFAVLLLIDYYFFQAIKTIDTHWSELRRAWVFRVYWGFSAFSFLFGLFSLITYQNPWFSKFIYLYTFCVIFIVVISKVAGSVFLLIDDIQRFFRWTSGFFQLGIRPGAGYGGGISRAKFLSYTALGISAIPFTTMIYGMLKTAFDFTIRRKTLGIINLPK
jgi:hypothetical protein